MGADSGSVPGAGDASEALSDTTPSHTPMPQVLDQQVFYHWGSTDADADLLRAGDYPFHGAHFADLSDGTTVPVSRKMMDVTRGWFKAHPGDTAGAGIYIAADPLSSNFYGPDLLVLHVRTKAGGNAIANFQLGYKGVRVPDIDAGTFDQYPVMSRYYVPIAWYVLSREPRADENVVVTVGPPSAQDVADAWKQMASGVRRGQLLADLAALALDVIKDHHAPTRTAAARIFFHRLVFDEAYRYLKDLGYQTAWTDAEASDLATFTLAFKELLPNDPRTAFLSTWPLPMMPAIFFEEEPAERHEQLLQAAGYALPATGHFYDQLRDAATLPVAINAAAFDLLSTGPAALHGIVGLSQWPTATGGDVVVVRAQRHSGGGLPWTRDWRLIDALGSGAAPTTPFSLSYLLMNRQLRLTRLPPPDEDVALTLAPPSASDPHDVWLQMSTGTPRAALLRDLADHMPLAAWAASGGNPQFSTTHLTPAGQAFMRGLVFDEMTPYLVGLHHVQDLTPDEQSAVRALALGLQQKAPSEGITAYMTSWLPN